ncbi:MAG: LPXTG cell wall anchor domain-containing protein [Microthrixaceae bacterium]
MGTRAQARIIGRTFAAVAVMLAGVAVAVSPASAQEGEPVPTEPTIDAEVIVEDTVPDETVPEDTTPDGEETTTTTTVAPEAAPEVPSRIKIVQTPSGNQGICVPKELGLTYQTYNDDQVFRLSVFNQAPLCEPLLVKAVVYAMPDNGEQWPQTLEEVVEFTLFEAGQTDIEFTKDAAEECNALQFDVLTGDTPREIAPLGAWHGPLLFTFDTKTSYQDVLAAECIPTPPEILSETTLPPAVAGTTQAPAQLALTGSSSGSGLALGSVLVLGGAAMLVASRRRNSVADPSA